MFRSCVSVYFGCFWLSLDIFRVKETLEGRLVWVFFAGGGRGR